MPKPGPHGGELALIERIRHDSAQRFVQRRSRFLMLGIGDDCAILRPPAGHEVLVTTDFTIEGRHFRRDWHSPESAGHRCLARGLSDLAAMGAMPMAAFLSLALPRSCKKSWIDRFFLGLRALGDRFSVPLAGGDTAESPTELIFADITLVGTAPAGRALRRSGARAGDVLYVTGQLGGSAAELDLLPSGRGLRVRGGEEDKHPQMFPEPRLAVGEALLRRGLAASCIDVSDGLSTDLAHLCRESEVAAEVDEAALPIHPLAGKLVRETALRAALHGGEDYELLFTAHAGVRVPRRIAGVAITPIGRIVRARAGKAAVMLVRADGTRGELKPGGWEHFRGISV
jgi:thiamine-monophosphate kinase